MTPKPYRVAIREANRQIMQYSSVAQELAEENRNLKLAIKRLLDESWNGAIDADHPARQFASDILEKY